MQERRNFGIFGHQAFIEVIFLTVVEIVQSF